MVSFLSDVLLDIFVRLRVPSTYGFETSFYERFCDIVSFLIIVQSNTYFSCVMFIQSLRTLYERAQYRVLGAYNKCPAVQSPYVVLGPVSEQF